MSFRCIPPTSNNSLSKNRPYISYLYPIHAVHSFHSVSHCNANSLWGLIVYEYTMWTFSAAQTNRIYRVFSIWMYECIDRLTSFRTYPFIIQVQLDFIWKWTLAENIVWKLFVFPRFCANVVFCKYTAFEYKSVQYVESIKFNEYT